MMFRKVIAGSVLAVVVSALAAGPALAIDGPCLWRELPAAKRAALQKVMAERELADADFEVSEADFVGWKRCGVQDDVDTTALGTLYGAVLMEKKSLANLSKRGVSERQLQTAWDGLAPEARKAFLAVGTGLIDKSQIAPETDTAARSAAAAAAQTLGVGDAQGNIQLALYLASRATAAVAEQRFD
jgi:hypothetical protein